MKTLRMFLAAIPVLAVLSLPALASAHVIVTPGQANVGEELIFTVSVPNEEQTAVTNLTLDIPAGVTGVTPTTKDGWTITTIKDKDSNVTAIIWSDGTIPVGQRQDFSFSATAPAKAGEVDWKAYQTYADGTVVHWDQKPAGSDDANGTAGPYSITSIKNDLVAQPSTTPANLNTTPALVVSLVALTVSISTVLFRAKK